MSVRGRIQPIRVQIIAVIVVVGILAGSSQPTRAYEPTDPVVTKMVDRGITYLESVGDKAFEGAQDPLSVVAGEAILVAYAHHKVRHNPDSPVVKRGLRFAKALVSSLERGAGEHSHKRVYSMSICVLLFAEVDPQGYRNELRVLQEELFNAQSGNGSYCYPNENPEREGDVSQAQYALLAIWTLDRNGLPLDYNRVTSTIQWMLRVQDMSGGWPYHGRDPGPGKPRSRQQKLSMSMALAGGSSVLIGGDALRLWGETVDDTDPGIPGLPKAIKIYKEDKNVKRRKRGTMSEAPIKNAVQLMNSWRQKNPYKRTQAIDWYYYQIYTMERFESFVEIANGLPKDSSPAWYNATVDELRQFQGADGGWTDRAHTRGPVSTAFALLFLIRSTQKTIFTMSQGSLQGGYGLPKDTTDIRVEGTQIKGRPIAAQVTDMLDILEEDGAGDTEGKSIPDNLELDTDPAARAAQMDRLERLVRGSQSWQARRVAARLLGKSDELRVVPALIFALSDPDTSVRKYARDGLRFISRRFEGFGMPDDPSLAELEQAQRNWRDWYRKMNPKYVFLDYDL